MREPKTKSGIPGKFPRKNLALRCVSCRRHAYNRRRRKGQAYGLRKHPGGPLLDGLFRRR
jgi:hypothetical protein